jgi:predicted mannosyl-3-phosphoglycerate phosphatase (HAD superfamily)
MYKITMDKRPKTIFCDIDGTLIQHIGNLTDALLGNQSVLEGTIETLNIWERKGYRIILTTGRKESMRQVTEKLLSDLGVFYDLLIMGIGGGDRIIINDKKPYSDDNTCMAYNLIRNQGIKDLSDI